MRSLLQRTLACAVVTFGCSSPPPPFADDASMDVFDVADAGIDSFVPDAGSDAAFDAGFDSGFDAGPPCICEERPCSVGSCEGARCVYTPLPTGVACGEASVCAQGECLVRFGCGDGFRERGEMREGCDDGNNVAGDGCSATCEPEAVAFAASSSPVAATDRWGWTLFVWSQPVDSGWTVWMQRAHRRRGFAEPELLTELAGGIDPAPAVTPLREGWAVVHHESDLDAGDLAFSIVDHDGLWTRETRRAPGRQHQTALATTPRGFIAAWQNEETGALEAQRFDEDARAAGPLLSLGDGSSPSLAASGATWLIVHEQGGELRARLVNEDALNAPYALGDGFSPAVVRSDEGWSVAHATRERDPRGDVVLVSLSESGEPLEGVTIASTEEAELAPVMGGPAIAFERGSVLTGLVRDVGLHANAPAADALQALLEAGGRQRAPRVERAGTDGVWMTWMDEEARGFWLAVD